jgi:hypothetical protein
LTLRGFTVKGKGFKVRGVVLPSKERVSESEAWFHHQRRGFHRQRRGFTVKGEGFTVKGVVSPSKERVSP